MTFIFKPLPIWAKSLFCVTWCVAFIIPWWLSFSWTVKVMISISVFLYGTFIGLRDVWRCLPYSIKAMQFNHQNNEWVVESKDGRMQAVRFAGDSIVSATVIFLRLQRTVSVPFYFPKAILFFSAQSLEAHRLCLLALYEYGGEQQLAG